MKVTTNTMNGEEKDNIIPNLMCISQESGGDDSDCSTSDESYVSDKSLAKTLVCIFSNGIIY